MHLDYIEIEIFLKYNYRFQILFLFLVHFLLSDSKLSFPPAANFPQIKFGSASMLSLSTCCILRHVFICHLDQIHIFPYSLIV